MKAKLPVKLAALATGFLAIALPIGLARAALFGQQEVEQDNFVAVATPFGSNQFNLVVIEQIPGKRDCWDELGSNPTLIEPLWTTFDFTGSCRRSVDSNGYSVRINGEDLGLEYLLRVTQRGGELQLVGTPRIGTSRPDLEEILIGSTNGIRTGDYHKIILEPGWKFTKRTYQGDVLGHIYFTYDQGSLPDPSPSPSPSPSPTPTPTPIPSPSPSPSPTPDPSFRDINNDIYREEIEAALERGFIAGFPEDNTFRPTTALTREQVVSMVFEALDTIPNVDTNAPSNVSSNPFPDVAASRWSAAKIQWAKRTEIVSGYPDGRFRPTQALTRAELMAVLKKAAQYAETEQGKSSGLEQTETPFNFSDIRTHWANDLIREMSAYCGVASPVNEQGTAFYPNNSALRNYAAAATLRMLNCAED
ncbi:DUF3747 domain-containing protein [Spirulina sp. CS-785/01]|uniref:DUF3747 domain-containing protein n=1 Tax=Spirulina sp. CS-785/01 TaxID=3021716 RepID=UPI00232F6389|nr:DUF3747 domain-containing protein [Spirulina sp. CS-785/01]MDB9314309.1 DUF3747 domain-containing protein [Spirulina sp. CS-785/01]